MGELGSSAFVQCVEFGFTCRYGAEEAWVRMCVRACVPAVSWLFPAGQGSACHTRNLWLTEAKWLKVLLRHHFSVFVLLPSAAHLCQTCWSRRVVCAVAGRLRLQSPENDCIKLFWFAKDVFLWNSLRRQKWQVAELPVPAFSSINWSQYLRWWFC